jgi:hypothetical protein
MSIKSGLYISMAPPTGDIVIDVLDLTAVHQRFLEITHPAAGWEWLMALIRWVQSSPESLILPAMRTPAAPTPAVVAFVEERIVDLFADHYHSGTYSLVRRFACGHLCNG